jgi:RNA polymerase sigma-70 factor (ECF subfamily)
LSLALAYSVPGQTSELQELIQGCARNERAAQEKMYRLFSGRMMAVVRRYIDHTEQAEEVLNNGFLRAFQKVGQYNFQVLLKAGCEKSFFML